jgi:hypothetical protein
LTLIALFGMRENRGTGLLMRDRGRFDHPTKEPLWRIGIAWNRNSDKLPLISRLVKVVQAVVGDQEV